MLKFRKPLSSQTAATRLEYAILAAFYIILALAAMYGRNNELKTTFISETVIAGNSSITK